MNPYANVPRDVPIFIYQRAICLNGKNVIVLKNLTVFITKSAIYMTASVVSVLTAIKTSIAKPVTVTNPYRPAIVPEALTVSIFLPAGIIKLLLPAIALEGI